MVSQGYNGRYTPERVMAIFAHPDDIEFSCAGTIARWVKDGAVGCYVVITSGQVGIKDPAITAEEAAAIRKREQTAAAKAVGVEDVVYLDYMDGMLENTLELRQKLVREIRRFKPEVVICGDPTAYFRDTYINHPDHRAAAAAAIDAVFPAAGMPVLYKEIETQEGFTAHETRKVYVRSWNNADTWVDISDSIDLKIAALREHVSQIGDWDPEDRLKTWAAEVGRGKEMAYAESFRVITLRDDEYWAKWHGRVPTPADLAADKAAREAEGEDEAHTESVR